MLKGSACGCLVVENKTSGAAGPLMLPSQICHAAARPEVPVLAALYALAVMECKASATPLNFDYIAFPKFHAIEMALRFDAFVVALF